MPDHYVLAYGTLRDPARVSSLLGRTYDDPVRLATVAGFTRREHKYFYAVADASDSIEGFLIGPFSDAELDRLDQFEGCQHGFYTREQVAITRNGEPAGDCWLYVGAGIRSAHESHLAYQAYMANRSTPCH